LFRRIIYRLKKGDRGVSVIEFALLLPLLITLVIGIIEFGWILTGYITVTGAAREGVRVAVVDGDYVQAVYNHTASMPALVIDTPSLEESAFGEKMTVTVTGSLSTLVGFFDFLGDTYNFNAEASMRQEFKND